MLKRYVKHMFPFFISLACIFLCACGMGKQNAEVPTQEEQFMTAMKEGLIERFADNRDTANMSVDEITAYYKTLVNYELSRLSVYENVTFSDEQFNTLAHKYINGCKQQLNATNIKDEFQMYAEWGVGRAARIEAAMALHDDYKLQLPQEILDEFSNDQTYTLEDYAQDATALMKENAEEGVDGTVEVGPDGILILRLWIDGFSSDAYWASQGSEASVTAYTDELLEVEAGFSELQENINQGLLAAGLPKTEIELHIMNDVNRENTITIIKKGRVVYDNALGIDMLGVGENMK